MSKKTQSPVTLSVKNGTSTSMLYGFARTCNSTTLPILILGSLVSAVLSSSSVPDSMLFQINSIKYFIRENTGELSSYTYASDTHLVKLASKKKGDAGEMVGIGERIEIYKMRDPLHLSPSEKADIEAGKVRSSLGADGRTQSKNDCSCTELGYLPCLGECALGSSIKQEEEITPTHYFSEDSSSRASLENDFMQASLGLQDTLMSSMEHQEGSSSSKTESKNTSKKFHSELHYQLGKPKDQYTVRKAMLGINSEGLMPPSNEDDMQAIVIQSTQGINDELKVKGKKFTSLSSVALQQQSNLVNYEKNVVPKIECEMEDEGVDIDVLGDSESGKTILTDLRQQLEEETTQVHNITAQLLASTKDSNKRKDLKGSLDGPPFKKVRAGEERPCPRSRKTSLGIKPIRKGLKLNILNLEDKLKVLDKVDAGASMQAVCAEFNLKTSTYYGIKRKRDKIRLQSLFSEHHVSKVRRSDAFDVLRTADKEEEDNKDGIDLSSRYPTHLAHLEPSPGHSPPMLLEENDSNAYILTKGKMSSLQQRQSQFMTTSSRNKQKEKMLFDGEGQGEERNSEIHNKLERMRRRVMRHLFMYLQKVICKVPRNPLITHTVTHAKKTVLCAGQNVCEILKFEERRLILEEEQARSERSALIKHLAKIIGDCTEEIKMKWRNWVKDHMQNPTAKQTFENSWQPLRLMEDILKDVVEGNSSDEGSPMPAGSPIPGPSSGQGNRNRKIRQKIKRQPGKRMIRKKGKKLGRPHKIIVNTGQGGPGADAPLPTSILLMAGTSSRGRKLLRKEDTNFVTS